MSMVVSDLRALLARRCGALFFCAGVLLFVRRASIVLAPGPDSPLGGLFPDEIAGYLLAGLPGFLGLTLPFFALFGLYPRLVDRTPRFAVAGAALAVLSPVLFVGFLAAFALLGAVALPVLWLVPIPFALGTALFGVAFLRTDGSARSIGVPLLGLAATWVGAYGFGYAYGMLPGWFPFTELHVAALLTVGVLLATDRAPSLGEVRAAS